MNSLQLLQHANPNLKLYDVRDAAFAPYGRVLSVGNKALFAAIRRTEIPAEGNRYVASDPSLEELDAIHAIARTVYGGMPVQAGFCNGRGFTLNAEGYHKCSEVNCTTTGLVLLLALPEHIRSRSLDSRDVVGFFLPPETVVEIHPRVLHFAPCRIRPEGFNCLVVLEHGTNEPLDAVDPTLPGEDALLWMRNKWLLCHPDSPQAQKGAFVGISGENIQLNLP